MSNAEKRDLYIKAYNELKAENDYQLCYFRYYR